MIISTLLSLSTSLLGWYIIFTRPTNIINISSLLPLYFSKQQTISTASNQNTNTPSIPSIPTTINTTTTPTLPPLRTLIEPHGKVSSTLLVLPYYFMLINTLCIILAICIWLLILIIYLSWNILTISWGIYVNILNVGISSIACYFWYKEMTIIPSITESLQNQLQSPSSSLVTNTKLDTTTIPSSSYPKPISAGYDKYGHPRRSMDFNHLGHPIHSLSIISNNSSSTTIHYISNPEKKVGHIISTILTQVEDDEKENENFTPLNNDPD